MRDTQQIGLDSILVPFVKGKQWLRLQIILFLVLYILRPFDQRSIFFYPVYICIYIYIQKLVTLERIIKEYLPGIIKEKRISWYKNARISEKID